MGIPAIVLTVASTVLTAYGQIQQGKAADAQAKAQQQGLEYQAKQREAAAVQERAQTQRRVIEENRQKNLVKSKVVARSAASGAGALDGSVVDIMGDLEQEGEYNKGVALYEGEERARSLETGAAIDRYEGQQVRAADKAAKKSSYLAAGSTIFKGASSIAGSDAGKSMYERFK